jgi:hypothetical protein
MMTTSNSSLEPLSRRCYKCNTTRKLRTYPAILLALPLRPTPREREKTARLENLDLGSSLYYDLRPFFSNHTWDEILRISYIPVILFLPLDERFLQRLAALRISRIFYDIAVRIYIATVLTIERYPHSLRYPEHIAWKRSSRAYSAQA